MNRWAARSERGLRSKDKTNTAAALRLPVLGAAGPPFGTDGAPKHMERLATAHGKLHHKTPPWVNDGAIFHIRIRAGDGNAFPLTDPALAQRLLDSVRLYEKSGRWYVHLCLLMPDHLHALLTFDLRRDSMAHVLADWKGFHSRKNRIRWQDNFFDHRIRNREEFEEKAHYIRMNPVTKGLCAKPEEWPFVVDRSTIGS